MEQLNKHLEKSSSKDYYERKLAKLPDEKKAELESLLVRLVQAGAKNPLQWAMSEVCEGIPQFGRFLVLKALFTMAALPEETIDLAWDFDEDIKDKYARLLEKTDKQELLGFLSSFSKGLIAGFVDLIDEGNPEYERDKISWVLMKTDEEGEPTGQIIQGLHEDFLEFENEIE